VGSGWDGVSSGEPRSSGGAGAVGSRGHGRSGSTGEAAPGWLTPGCCPAAARGAGKGDGEESHPGGETGPSGSLSRARADLLPKLSAIETACPVPEKPCGREKVRSQEPPASPALPGSPLHPVTAQGPSVARQPHKEGAEGTRPGQACPAVPSLMPTDLVRLLAP